jgi:hypothetical protein
MFVSKLEKTSEKRIPWDFWEVLDPGSVCSIQKSNKKENCTCKVDTKGLVRDIEQHRDFLRV